MSRATPTSTNDLLTSPTLIQSAASLQKLAENPVLPSHVDRLTELAFLQLVPMAVALDKTQSLRRSWPLSRCHPDLDTAQQDLLRRVLDSPFLKDPGVVSTRAADEVRRFMLGSPGFSELFRALTSSDTSRAIESRFSGAVLDGLKFKETAIPVDGDVTRQRKFVQNVLEAISPVLATKRVCDQITGTNDASRSPHHKYLNRLLLAFKTAGLGPNDELFRYVFGSLAFTVQASDYLRGIKYIGKTFLANPAELLGPWQRGEPIFTEQTVTALLTRRFCAEQSYHQKQRCARLVNEDTATADMVGSLVLTRPLQFMYNAVTLSQKARDEISESVRARALLAYVQKDDDAVRHTYLCAQLLFPRLVDDAQLPSSLTEISKFLPVSPAAAYRLGLLGAGQAAFLLRERENWQLEFSKRTQEFSTWVQRLELQAAGSISDGDRKVVDCLKTISTVLLDWDLTIPGLSERKAAPVLVDVDFSDPEVTESERFVLSVRGQRLVATETKFKDKEVVILGLVRHSVRKFYQVAVDVGGTWNLMSLESATTLVKSATVHSSPLDPSILSKLSESGVLSDAVAVEYLKPLTGSFFTTDSGATCRMTLVDEGKESSQVRMSHYVSGKSVKTFSRPAMLIHYYLCTGKWNVANATKQQEEPFRSGELSV